MGKGAATLHLGVQRPEVGGGGELGQARRKRGLHRLRRQLAAAFELRHAGLPVGEHFGDAVADATGEVGAADVECGQRFFRRVAGVLVGVGDFFDGVCLGFVAADALPQGCLCRPDFLRAAVRRR